MIAGTKFPVRSVVNYVLRQGMAPEELAAEFRHLTLAQIHDALSYYYDHQDEVKRDIAANTESSVRSRSGAERGNLLLDEDVRPLLAGTLRQRGFDARHVDELKRSGLSDAEQLAFAAKQRRAFL